MLIHVDKLLPLVLLGNTLVGTRSQFAPDGDPGALSKMKATIASQEKTRVRVQKREQALAERAVKRMVAAEKAQLIQDFIDRGSLFLPGEGPTEEDEKPAGTLLKFNENVGEQAIDPRTPQGFGNPFFRQIHVEQAVEVRKLISENEEAAIRKADLPLRPVIRSGWTLVDGKGSLNSRYEYSSEFIMNLMSSPNKIIRRVCKSCHISRFKEIYYKRLTSSNINTRSLNGMINGPFDNSTQHVPFEDYLLHSTYKDAVDGTGVWNSINPSSYGFPGASGPDDSTLSSDVAANQFNGGANGQPDFAFYVEDSAWIPVTGYGSFNMPGTRNGERVEETYLSRALQALYDSGNGIIRMICNDCESGFEDLYYKRVTAIPDDLLTTLLHDFKQKGGNILNRDFKIFSSYADALNNTDPWEVCDYSDEKMGFPAKCRPTLNATAPEKFFRAVEGKLWKRSDASTNRHMGFYVESNHIPETDEWMSESDEMEAFFFPESTLEAEDKISCDAETFDDTIIHENKFFTDSLQPYAFHGQSDSYAGWYDVQGCGMCNDWCGWFAPPGTTVFDGRNPYYKSWTDTDSVFACVTGRSDSSTNYLRVSGIDSNVYIENDVNATSYSEFSDQKYSGWKKFFPSVAAKCNSLNDHINRPPYQYIGCYEDTPSRALSQFLGFMSTESCYINCKSRGKFFFGMQYNNQCYCDGENESWSLYAKYGESDKCRCDGSNKGSYVNCVYQIFDPDRVSPPSIPPSWSNVARNYIDVHQSSTHYHHGRGYLPASYAVDNCFNTHIDAMCMTHTKRDYNAWWYVRLNSAYTINSVNVLNRGDCCRDRMRGFTLTLFHNGAVVYNSDSSVPGYTSYTRMNYYFSIPNLSVDYAQVQILGRYEELHITEFELIGTPITASPTRAPSKQPTATRVCETLMDKVTNEISPEEMPLALLESTNSVSDPFVGYYDVQRCGKCNDWCGWFGVDSILGDLPPNPWFKTSTGSKHFTCKLAEGVNSAYGMTPKGYFNDDNPDENFSYQKCSGKGADTPVPRKEQFLGCFHDSAQSRLPVLISNGINVPFYDCAAACKVQGYHYFGRQGAGECRCGGLSASDTSYANEGKILSIENAFCGDCLGDDIGTNKNCVFRITDQFDPEVERSRHPCSHITMVDVRRYCYVACRDKDKDLSHVPLCISLSATGLIELTNKISNWADSPLCDTKDCQKSNHPLGEDVNQSKGTF